jgi:hypothetical protein
MEATVFVMGITLALMMAALDSVINGLRSPELAFAPGLVEKHAELPLRRGVEPSVDEAIMNAKKPEAFTIEFGEGKFSPAMRIGPEDDPTAIIERFGLITPRPTIFITGGASQMSDDDIERTREIVYDGIAYFAETHNLTVIDGGTEAGVMQMIGEARKSRGYKFPLIGVCPESKVSYPGYQNPAQEAVLEDGHSHFVLIDSPEWGDESQMIVNLTRAIAAGQPMIGILINGGKIAERDVYLATTQGDNRVPILVLDGSGRTATNIANAFKTGQAASDIIKAIIAGGDIKLTAINDGKEAMIKKLSDHFHL